MRKTILHYIAIWAIFFVVYVLMDFDGAAGFEAFKLVKAALFSTALLIIWELLVERNRRKREAEKEEVAEQPETTDAPTVEKMVEQYGEPSATLVTDGTQGMAPDSTVLIYEHGGIDGNGFLVYNGLKIDKTSITDMTFHRDERPLYKVQNFTFPEKFEIILNTTDEEHPKVFVNAGHDLELAKETLVELRKYLD